LDSFLKNNWITCKNKFENLFNDFEDLFEKLEKSGKLKLK
jgi:hypothetical protein